MRLRLMSFGCFAILFAIAAASGQPVTGHNGTPKLAVIIVVDQMRPDHLTRFDHLYVGGIRRMLDRGFLFLNGFHNHALTETGAGYAAISTGAFPSRNGITGNSWYDKQLRRSYYCVEDSTLAISGKPSKPGRSPVTMKSMTLGDWVWRNSQDSKNFSIAIKDRAAVTMAGFRGSHAFWYDSDDGTFVTSQYYDVIYPEWIREINEGSPADQYFTGVWERLLPDSAYEVSRADQFPGEADGVATTFPHNFLPGADDDPNDFYKNIRSTPFADHMVIEIAKSCVLNEKLGSDDAVDLLWIGCSAADYIGHEYGPFSQEAQDYYLRLDSYLEGFFVHLDSLLRRGSYVVALTSDHGVLPLPEYLEQQGSEAGRLNPDSVEGDVKRIGVQVAEEFGLPVSPILEFNRGVYLDEDVITAARVDRRRVEIEIAARLKLLAYVEDAFTTNDLTENTIMREYQQLFRNSYYEGRSPDIMLRIKENWLVSGWPQGTTHGSCYTYDTDVPILFYGAGVPHGSNEARVATVSIAPTIGELIGYPAQHELDGTSLSEYLKGKR